MNKVLAPIKARIIQFIDNHGIDRESFFEKIGVASSNFRGVGRYSEIGGDKIVKILTHFKELNPAWLVMGEGKMLRDVEHNDYVNEDAALYENKTRIEELRSALKDKERIIKMLRKENLLLKKGNPSE